MSTKPLCSDILKFRLLIRIKAEGNQQSLTLLNFFLPLLKLFNFFLGLQHRRTKIIRNKMDNEKLDGRKRKNIQIGDVVEIVQKQHQRSGELTEGIVKRILTKAANHPHGIKVMLQLGEVGRVKNILFQD